MATASVPASSRVIPDSIVANNLILPVADGPKYRVLLGATRAIAIANSRECRQKEEVEKRGAPKI